MQIEIKTNGLKAPVPTKIKDGELIDEKRRRIIKGALSVFKKKGYHKTTVRDITRISQVSMGCLYDYINCKEDLLYLFFESFLATLKEKALTNKGGNPKEKLRSAYKALLEACFSLEDEVLFGWTEAKNMKKQHLTEALKLEMDLINYFKSIMEEIKDTFKAPIADTNMAANFLVYSALFGVLRRWALNPQYSKEQIIDYLIKNQVEPLLSSPEHSGESIPSYQAAVNVAV
jgi:AcrR family transcriptional regulator